MGEAGTKASGEAGTKSIGEAGTGALVVSMERQIAASPAVVWGHVGSTAGIKAWLGPKYFEDKLGGRVLFDVLHGEQRWLMFGTVQELRENELLSFSWQEFDCAKLTAWPAATLVSISLTPMVGGTLVRLTHTGFEALPDAVEQHKGYVEGWQSYDGLGDLEQLCLTEQS